MYPTIKSDKPNHWSRHNWSLYTRYNWIPAGYPCYTKT